MRTLKRMEKAEVETYWFGEGCLKSAVLVSDSVLAEIFLLPQTDRKEVLWLPL